MTSSYFADDVIKDQFFRRSTVFSCLVNFELLCRPKVSYFKVFFLYKGLYPSMYPKLCQFPFSPTPSKSRIKFQDLDCGDSICNISSLSMQMEIKSVSKVSRHFAFFVNVFLDFDAIIDFSLAMNSYGYEDIFSHSPLIHSKNQPYNTYLIHNQNHRNKVHLCLTHLNV